MNDLFNQSKYNPNNQSVLDLINDFEKKYSNIFIKVKKEWNNTIREFLRDSTGLKLRTKYPLQGFYSDATVNINFKPDRKDEFIKLVDENFPDLNFFEYKQLKEFLEIAMKTKEFLKKDSEYFKEINDLIKYCDEYFKKYNLKDIVSKLFASNAEGIDIWGCYTYGYHTIEIYYLPIIVFCNLNSIDIESAIVKVLTHELSHAYHDAGKDRDGKIWSDMQNSDVSIKEGLAQYYTERFIEEYSPQYPKLKQAYDTMVSCQSGPYIVHKDWSKRFSQETVKFAMITARQNNIREYKVFLEKMESIKKQLK